jgi:hypothetical protein
VNPTEISLVALIGALVVGNLAAIVTMVVYLGSRIDRLAEQMGGLKVEVAALRAEITHHSATEARMAHGR